MRPFSSDNEIIELIRRFETGNIAREDWHHAEHLVVALYYVNSFTPDAALTKMRDGIFGLLRSFAVDLVKEMPYHETLTVFWLNTVDEFNRTKNGIALWEKANELVGKYHKDHPLNFYSREVLFSDAAREAFVPGDLRTATPE